MPVRTGRISMHARRPIIKKYGIILRPKSNTPDNECNEWKTVEIGRAIFHQRYGTEGKSCTRKTFYPNKYDK